MSEMSKKKKTIVLVGGIVLMLAIVGSVFWLIQKQNRKEIASKPSPTPVKTPTPSPQTPGVFEVAPQQNNCTTDFVVEEPSPTPSESPSPTPSPSAPPAPKLSCVVKRVYQDESDNSPGFYYLRREILDTATVEVGENIVFNVVVRNDGGGELTGVMINDKLSTAVEFEDADGGCSYKSTTRELSCEVGSLSEGMEGAKSFRVKVLSAGRDAIANTAEVTSEDGQSASCSIVLDSEGKVVPPPSPSPVAAAPSALPNAGIMEITTRRMGWGVGLILLGLLGVWLL